MYSSKCIKISFHARSRAICNLLDHTLSIQLHNHPRSHLYVTASTHTRDASRFSWVSWPGAVTGLPPPPPENYYALPAGSATIVIICLTVVLCVLWVRHLKRRGQDSPSGIHHLGVPAHLDDLQQRVDERTGRCFHHHHHHHHHHHQQQQQLLHHHHLHHHHPPDEDDDEGFTTDYRLQPSPPSDEDEDSDEAELVVQDDDNASARERIVSRGESEEREEEELVEEDEEEEEEASSSPGEDPANTTVDCWSYDSSFCWLAEIEVWPYTMIFINYWLIAWISFRNQIFT